MQTEASPQTYDWYYRFAAYLATILACVAAISLFLFASDVVLLIFAAALWSVVLNHLAAWIHRHTGIPYLAVVVTILVLIVASVIAAGWFLQQWIAQQTQMMVSGIQKTYEQIRQAMEASPFWSNLQPLLTAGDQNTRLLNTAQRFLTSSFGFVGSGVFIFVVGAFFAADPHLYRNGAARFFTQSRRPAVLRFLDASGEALMSWMFGQLFSMSVIAVLTSTALYFLDVPAAILLGLVAGAITFIPNIGPLLAIIPAALLALQQGFNTALAVIGIYLVIELLESNLLTPLVQQHQINLPPAILTSAQLFAGLLFGLLAIALTAPIMAILIVLLEHWYFPICDRDESPVAELVKPEGEIEPDSAPAATA